jgi:hypothetical protein
MSASIRPRLRAGGEMRSWKRRDTLQSCFRLFRLALLAAHTSPNDEGFHAVGRRLESCEGRSVSLVQQSMPFAKHRSLQMSRKVLAARPRRIPAKMFQRFLLAVTHPHCLTQKKQQIGPVAGQDDQPVQQCLCAADLQAVAQHARGVHQRVEVVRMYLRDSYKSGLRLIPASLPPEMPGALKIRQIAFFKGGGSSRHSRLFRQSHAMPLKDCRSARHLRRRRSHARPATALNANVVGSGTTESATLST